MATHRRHCWPFLARLYDSLPGGVRESVDVMAPVDCPAAEDGGEAKLLDEGGATAEACARGAGASGARVCKRGV